MRARAGGGQRWPEAAARAVRRARMERLVQELTERPEEPHSGWLLERVKARMANERVKRMLESLVKRSGSAAHLIPDTLLLAKDVLDYNAPSQQAYVTALEVEDAVASLLDNTLVTALQGADADYAAQCPHCQPDQAFMITYSNRSGSGTEGLSEMGKGSTLYLDVLHEIGGPFTWAARPVGTLPPTRITPRDAPQLWAKPTNNARNVTLHWVPTTRCRHEAPLGALPADSIRRLMERHCRVVKGGNNVLAGPAVNVSRPDDATGFGTDHVPCLRLPGWWPAEVEFVNRCRQVDFPPAAVRDGIRSFGVHLVPVGRPGSETEAIEWQVSLARAELVATHHLSAVQHATIAAVKQMKRSVEEDRRPSTTLKSYFIKTAIFWLVQDQPSGSWASVSDGVRWVLDWLERHLSTGTLPCFFWDEINIAAMLSQDQLQAIISTVQLMRREMDRLLMTCCLNWTSLDILLEDGTEPLTERQLRHRLGRLLVRKAVLHGTLYRPQAPCWEPWMNWAVPILARTSQDRLFQWLFRIKSSAYRQQCLLWLAWTVVDAEDLAGGTQLPPLHGDLVTLDVTPLMSLLTEADLVLMLGDPAAVAAWCKRQLRRPPAERPAGLTSELDTPRGRAELLLRPKMLLRAIREAAPLKLNFWESRDKETFQHWKDEFRPPRTLRQLQDELERLIGSDLEARLRQKLPAEDGLPIAATARLWREELQLLMSGDRLRTGYEAARTRWPDRWQLLPHLVQELTLDDEGRCMGADVKWQQLREWQVQDRQNMDQRHAEERRSMDQRHLDERRSMDQRHLDETRNMDQHHIEERRILEQR